MRVSDADGLCVKMLAGCGGAGGCVYRAFVWSLVATQCAMHWIGTEDVHRGRLLKQA